jgi:DNA helicase HerA-like ATPase
VLISHPEYAVSIQLIPTVFSNDEIDKITQYSQMLDSLSKGIMAPGSGNISFSSAEYAAARYKYYQANKDGALFEYNILVYGSATATEDIASAYYGYANHDNGSPSFLKNIRLKESDLNTSKNFIVLPWIARAFLQNYDRNNAIWNQGTFRSFYRLPYVITADEATMYFRLPIGSANVSAGLPVDESGKTSKSYADNLINAGDITIGELKSSSQKDTIGIRLNDLTKHMLVVGTPGSGKTTFSVSVLDRLWKDHHIPFLVIEPAKNEYRALVQSIPDLQVFTPGKNFISPFVYNPFVPPKNVKLETYKSTLKTAFAAGVSMTTPLDKIFEETINNCYSDFRWLDSYTVDNKGRIFNISDFIKCFQKTFDDIGYTGDARNIGRAGVVRLKSLVNLFDNYSSIPIEDLLSKPTVIELAAIENSDQKALIIALLLLSILAYVNSNYLGEGKLRNVILLEEAHVLLDADTNSGQGEANPSQIAQGLVKRMLAEIRSYGVGIIIADQSPRKVSTDVVALTDMKVVFRLVEATDKQIVSDSMNMNEAQEKRLARLKPGEAFLFFNRLDEPEEVKTPNYRLENNIDITLSDENISKLSMYWKDKEELLRPYPECSYINFCNKGCDYEQRLLGREIARRIFTRHFKPTDNNFDPVKRVFGSISNLIKNELNDEEFTPRLLACVKCQLWRKIKYETSIPIKDTLVEKSLKKAG